MIDQATIERVSAAIDSADVGFNMKLTRLVDGVHTYELRMDGKVEEFDNTDDLYIRVREIKQRKQAEAIIRALGARERRLEAALKTLSHYWQGEYWAGVSPADSEKIRAAISASEVEG
ncbi:hypothetical protein [Rhizobium sp. S163]|uniref:hypothetical protein n=1 Tax=Rhizobium sp. S163 TaxID=3055039 RepID=UPI0025A9D2AA|nr:hypothetical protein [Rhizobium sp. S163]MDM9644517.1 hypothetical protein [Rhizobium sp. S163]